MKLNKPAIVIGLVLVIGIIIGKTMIKPASQKPDSSPANKATENAATKPQGTKPAASAPDNPETHATSQPPKTRQPPKSKNIWDSHAIRFADTQGKEHSSKDWKGKVIMLNFWASWCGPCQYEIPRFVGYQKQYHEKGFQIIGLGIDQANKLANVERSLEMNYPTLVIPEDQQYKLMRTWGNTQNFVPFTVVINRNGMLQYVHRGVMDDEDFETNVLPLLKT